VTTVRKPSAGRAAEVPVERLRPGHIIGASGARTIVSEGIDHDTYWSFVVRYTNGVHRIETWASGSTVVVVGRDLDVIRQVTGLRSVD
jgi:hypothetical protein